MPTIRRYARVWYLLVTNSMKAQMSTALGSAGYLVGKLIRIGFFFAYIFAIFKNVPSLKGYRLPEVVLFFLTFNILDVGAQFLFRGLYGVKILIDEGDFDKYLTQPIHLLFRISVMGTDFLDLLTLIPIGFMTAWTLHQLPNAISPMNVIAYIFLIGNAMIISYAFHVLIGAFSVKTQEVESAIWIYRDVMTLGRFPISIYSEGMRLLFVTALPIGVMISFPSEALLGLFTWKGVAYAVFLGVCLHLAAQSFWRHALRRYTSNSI